MARAPATFQMAADHRQVQIVSQLDILHAYVTDEDCARARELMFLQRHQDKRGSPSKDFTHKEATPVLRNVAMGAIDFATPGLVQELFQYGASVCIRRPKSKNILKRMMRVDQIEDRSDVLLHAARRCPDEVFRVLASHADQTALDQTLPVAICQNRASIVFILLEAGAEASYSCCIQFPAVVESGAEDMCRVLLRKSNGVCQSCRNKELVRASTRRCMNTIKILLDNGADATFDTAVALRDAARGGQEDIVTAIISRAKPRLSPSLLDLGVKEAYASGEHGAVMLCLRAGAKGPSTNTTLIQAVHQAQMELVDTLVRYNASVNHEGGAAVISAVDSMQPELLRIVLCGKPTYAVMAVALMQAMKLDEPSTTYEMSRILLDAGLREDPVGEALIQTFTMPSAGEESDQLELMLLLLQQGEANINVQGGQALVMAVSGGRHDILSLFLQYRPSPESLNAALRAAMGLVEPATRFKIVSMILEAGVSGAAVDEALECSASGGLDSVGLTSVILQYSSSSVDSNGGLPLVVAVWSQCIDQMRALMAAKFSQKTLAAGWNETDNIGDNGNFQFDAYKMLLETGGVAQHLQDCSLVIAAARGQSNHSVCNLLLQNSASPENLDGAALVAAARNLHIDTLQMLAQHTKSIEIFRAALVGALSEGTQWLSPRGLEVVDFLLQRGASGPEVDQAFCLATSLYNVDAAELLINFVHSDTLNKALGGMVQQSSDWHFPDDRNLGLVSLLLGRGVHSEIVNAAFLKALAAYVQQEASEHLIDTLFFAGVADSNFPHEEALKIAVGAANVPLLKMLVSKCTSQVAMTEAFADAVLDHRDVDLSLALIDALVGGTETGIVPNFKSLFRNQNPPIIACLTAHPESARLVKRLVELGCDPEARLLTTVYADEYIGEELATALTWALSRKYDCSIATAAIEVLIDAKVNLNSTTSKSKTTPLILAAKYRSGDVVKKLLKMKVNSNARDCFGRSSLFYASRAGDLDSVNYLIKAKCPTDDGSLHEAARCLHSEVVSALIKGKHNVNFPSTKEPYYGRSPLQEMAYKCNGSEKTAELEATIVALVEGKANVLDRWRGKNALFLALENTNWFAVTQALIDKAMWDLINDEENVFKRQDEETGAIHFMSPTIYVRWLYGLKDSARCRSQEQLLHDKRCEDRYYAPLGAPQPDGAVGLPAKIQEAEDKLKDQEEKRRNREYEHKLKLQRELEEAQQIDAIERARYEAWLYQQQGKAALKHDQLMMSHQQQLYQSAERTNQEQKQRDILHEQQLEQKAQAARQQQYAQMRKNELIAAARQQESMQRIQVQDSIQALRIKRA